MVPDRTAKACRKRWVNGLNDRLKKGSWTHEEDERLREGVAILSCDWARIAEHVGQRSGDQCSKRWREVLDPTINKSPWTEEEDTLLTQLYEKHGSGWQVMSTHFNNRRALQCRNRCCKLLGLHAYPRAKKPSKETFSPALSTMGPTAQDAIPVPYMNNTMPNIDFWPNLAMASEPVISAHHEIPTIAYPAACFDDTTMQYANMYQASGHDTPLVQSTYGAEQDDPVKRIMGWQDTPFPSFKRKGRPTPLDLSETMNMAVGGQESYYSPFLSSPSLCSSTSTATPSPSVSDANALHFMLNAPPGVLSAPMPGQMNDFEFVPQGANEPVAQAGWNTLGDKMPLFVPYNLGDLGPEFNGMAFPSLNRGF